MWKCVMCEIINTETSEACAVCRTTRISSDKIRRGRSDADYMKKSESGIPHTSYITPEYSYNFKAAKDLV